MKFETLSNFKKNTEKRRVKLYSSIVPILIPLAATASDWSSVFAKWGSDVKAVIKSLTKSFIIPVALTGMIAVIIFLLVKIGISHRNGDGAQMQDKVIPLVILIGCTILVSTATAWAWNLM